MVRIIPYAAIQFTAHEQWRRVLQVDKDGTYVDNYFCIYNYTNKMNLFYFSLQ